MKVFFLIFLLAFTSFFQLSANKKDSLLKVVKTSQSAELQVEALLSLSTMERSTDSVLCLDYARKAISLSRKIEDKTFLVRSYLKLGITYKYYDCLDKSLGNYFAALELAKQIKDEKWQAATLNSMGSLYLQYEQNKKALEYYNQSNVIAKQIDDSVGICNALNNIGIIYWHENNLDSSAKYLQQSLVLSLALGDSSGLISSYNNLGMIHTSLGNNNQALGYYNQAIIIAKKEDDKWEIANTLNNKASLSIKSNKLETVESSLLEAISLAREINSKTLQGDSYLILSDYYLAIDELKKSLDAFKIHSKINTELINVETTEKIASIQKDYELKAKDRNLEKLSLANNIQYYLIVLLASSLSLLGIFMYIYFRKYNENKSISSELTDRNIELENLSESRSKLFTLFSHDLKAPLYNISNLSNLMNQYRFDMDESEKEETLTQLSKSSNYLVALVDNILLWARTQIGNVENNPEELWVNSVVVDCVDVLTSYAMEKDILLENKADEIKVIADYSLLSVSIRNLISNAIKFSHKGNRVIITTRLLNNEVDIIVKDEGVGMDEEKLEKVMTGHYTSDLGTNNEKGTGLGLKITKEFIELNGGKLTAESRLNLGSTFTITLPIAK